MPILDLQRSMRRLGRIRMGSKVANKSGNGDHPVKLETWRLTSPSKDLLDAAAVLYGGTVTEWEGSPNGQQFELFTDTRSLEVIIPPGEMAFSQFYELWSAGGCARRCDGITEQQSGEACICPADREQRLALAGKGQACKPTTRLFVIQPHLPDVGLWHMESHGFYAAVELAGSIEVLHQASATGGLIPARLTIEQRQVKRGAETRNFAVPVIELPTLTAHTLMTGEIPAGEIGPQRQALPAPPAVPVVPPATPALTTAQPAATVPSAPARKWDDNDPRPNDGGTFARAIKQSAKRAQLDADTLDDICVEAAGVKLADLSGPKAANAVLAAIAKRGVPVS
jgi:hypothetical protein